MGLDNIYPYFATDNIFINPWKPIREHSIQSPLYFSTGLYRVAHKHKCPEHRQTEQVYLPVQVPKYQVSPKSTQSGNKLWYVVGMISFPHHLILITH